MSEVRLRTSVEPLSLPALLAFILAYGHGNPLVEGGDSRVNVEACLPLEWNSFGPATGRQVNQIPSPEVNLIALDLMKLRNDYRSYGLGRLWMFLKNRQHQYKL